VAFDLLADGDEVILRGWCERDGAVRIGFGDCRGEVRAADGGARRSGESRRDDREVLARELRVQHLVEVLARKCAELQKLKGGENELQLTLKLLEDALGVDLRAPGFPARLDGTPQARGT